MLHLISWNLMVYTENMSGKDFVKKLVKSGWVLDRVKAPITSCERVAFAYQSLCMATKI